MAGPSDVATLDAIFKAYDVRGLVPEQLDAELAGRVGRAFVTVTRAPTVVVGHDMRPSSPGLAAAFAAGATDAGADVVYAPGLSDLGEIRIVVESVGVPVNVLALPAGPTVAELGSVGVRRVSTGGALARAAYGALMAGARELLDSGTSTYTSRGVSRDDLIAAF